MIRYAILAAALLAAPAVAEEHEFPYNSTQQHEFISRVCLSVNPDGGCLKYLGGYALVVPPGQRDEVLLPVRKAPVCTDCTPTAIPLPAGVWLLLAALGGLGLLRRARDA